MKIGDKVRFLSEVGGGRVAGFQGKEIVLVEDEDGFQVPMRMSEVVVIGDEDYDTKHVVEVKQKLKPAPVAEPEPCDLPVTFRKPAEERKGGDRLSAYMAFVPIDIRELTHTRFETFLVNDSNYHLRYVYMTAQDNSWMVRSTGEVEPNTKEYIEEFGREVLNELERCCVQLIVYKRDKPFQLKPAVDVQLRIDPVKFYKLHTFNENDFFEQPALLYTIVENDKPARQLVIDAQQLKQEMYNSNVQTSSASTTGRARKQADGHAQPLKYGGGADAPLVVDLHAGELLETTAGMSPVDILNYQLDVFRKTLKEHEKQKGMKIVFIHGKGEGVLRSALVNELKYRFKSYQYQDASFREFGYGATQVTIK